VWETAVDGRRLTFHLAGINNQNFIMRDDETGTWWQQVTGEAFLGPLKGRRLTLVPQDQLTFATWRSEAPQGRVLKRDERIARAGLYAPVNWERDMLKYQTPASASADTRLAPRALVVGVALNGAATAYPVDGLTAASATIDTVGGEPIVIVRAPDTRSTRVFDRRVDGRPLQFAVKTGAPPLGLLDVETGSEWDFAGMGVTGPLAGRRLRRVPFLEEYWFDWKTYHPTTRVFRH
jgi:hypothetical protein